MRELTKDEIKARQIEILKYFKKSCEALGLRYSLAYGTLLGAVRHGGYIPWDDDIDVCMPREDYDKLCAVLREKKGRFFLLDIHSNKDYYQNFAKIVDTETLFVRDNKAIKDVENYGINIDIFPYDNCPSDVNEYNIHRKKIISLAWKKSMIITKGVQKRSNVIKTIIRTAEKAVWCFFGLTYFMNKIENLVRKYNADKTELMCSWSVFTNFEKAIPAEWFNNLTNIVFEDEEYACFTEIDAFLTKLYGDYMTPPPEDKRVAPHGYTAYLKEIAEEKEKCLK